MGRAFEFRKARKFKRWGAMAKSFSKIGKEIAIAIKNGGPDEEANPKLRAAIQNARAANMPLENVRRAIKKASEKDTADYKEVTFEGYAPHGIAVLVEAATDNNQRTVANVRSYFNKCNGSLGTSGSVAFMFDHTCYLRIEDTGVDLEEFEFELIDFGAEEVFKEDEEIVIYGAFESFGSIQAYLEKQDIAIKSSGFDRIPNVSKELSDDQVVEVQKLLERMEEDEDVLNVYHNMV